jgi:hypothetical protein
LRLNEEKHRIPQTLAFNVQRSTFNARRRQERPALLNFLTGHSGTLCLQGCLAPNAQGCAAERRMPNIERRTLNAER